MDTFYSKYSDWYLPLDNHQRRQYDRLERLVLNFNKDLKSEVVRSKEKYNIKIRGVIAEKTGVSLTFRSSEIENRSINNKEVATIPIKIVDKVPTSLLSIFNNQNDNIIELLLHLRSMENSVYELEYQLENYSKFLNPLKNESDIESIKRTITHLNLLIKKVYDSNILDQIKKLGPDMLGAYYLRDSKVELYWLCIAFCSIIYNLPIEDFTLVVLIHELVHGYTHLGFDKDGHNWKTEDFGNADLKIVEGFAQLYTRWLCIDYFEKALTAFEVLLPSQSLEYTEFKNWFSNDERDKYEKARRILLKSRTKSIIKYPDFQDQLIAVKEDF